MTARPKVLVALVLACACARPPVPAPPTEVAKAGDVVALLERQERETRTLTATFRITARRDGRDLETSRGALVVERPDRLRLQLFSFGVMTVYDYTVNGDRFRIRRPLDGKTETGRFGDDGPKEARAYDLRPLFLRSGDYESARVERDGADWLVTLRSGEGERRIRVAGGDATVVDETLAIDEDLLRARYADYRDVEGLPLPFRIEVEYPARDVTLVIEIGRYTRNEPVEDSVFAF